MNPQYKVWISSMQELFSTAEDSVLTIGLADSRFPLNKHPGKLPESTGYNSRDGKLYYNKLHEGFTPGERFGEGESSPGEMVLV